MITKLFFYGFFLLFFSFNVHSKIHLGDIQIINAGKVISLERYWELQDGGDMVGNGGDLVTIEFKRIIDDVISLVEEQDASLAIKLEQAKERVSISSVENLVLAGNSVSALNFPDRDPPKIIIGQKAWKEVYEEEDRRRLVLHELLYIAGINDDQYWFSRRFNLGGSCEYPSAIRLAIESFYGKECSSISIEEVQHIDKLNLSIDKSIESWRKFSFEEFKGLKELSIKSIFIKAKDIAALLQKVPNKLRKLSLRETPLIKDFFEKETLKFIEKKANLILYGKLYLDDLGGIIEENVTRAIELDDSSLFKQVYEFVDERFLPDNIKGSWLVYAAASCSTQVVSFLVNEEKVDPDLTPEEVLSWGRPVFLHPQGDILSPLAHTLLANKSSKKCRKTLEVLVSAGANILRKSGAFSPIQLLIFKGGDYYAEFNYFFPPKKHLKSTEEVFDYLWKHADKSNIFYGHDYLPVDPRYSYSISLFEVAFKFGPYDIFKEVIRRTPWELVQVKSKVFRKYAKKFSVRDEELKLRLLQ